ncbi:PREDICTED: growth factor receptor-bound protein 14-like [Acropora digitifera]|uniref:growth factor receptor-bound protein 14-like n=1 Tax=Acropora digitifera TaxID=70779 RepID=UPI00077A5687|nr:PREDICTED: growth factor receptor-bound protein 14-like [Acropora digitifera]
MNAREACLKLLLLNKEEDGPHWVLVEHLTDLGLERNLEDHETVLDVLNTWAPGSNNKLLFKKDVRKYHFFAHTSNYFPPHLMYSEELDKAVTEKAQKAKTILQEKLFSSCTSIPELGGTLHCKEFGKKSWNKKFLLLRGSGIYLSNKGKSKPLRARELKELKCFSVDDDKTLMSWKMAVRIAKRRVKRLRCLSFPSSQNNVSEFGEGVRPLKEGQVAMDFTGDTGRLITDSKIIQELANKRDKVKLSQRMACNNFIPTDSGVIAEGRLFSEQWFHGRISREQSLELLMNAGLEDGLFLVRESCSVAGVYVLTFCMNLRVYHVQLAQDIGEGTQVFVSLGKGPSFSTLQELIQFYQQKPLNGVSLALRAPCPKP